MALGFFRRRQKMVIIIMVLLMVSFMVGAYGVNMILETNPNEVKRGDSRLGPITRGDLLMAEASLNVLRQLGFGDEYRARQWPVELAFVMLTRGSGDDPRTPFVLLLKEARASGQVVVKEEVDEFFRALGYADESTYKSVVSSLRSSRGWTERGIRQAAADWLRVYKCYISAKVNCPPSETELQLTYRDVAEGIDLNAVRLMAKDFVKDVPDPKPADVQKQFEDFRVVYAAWAPKPMSMGFGYRQQAKARVQYLLARGEVVGRVTEPAFDTLVDYFNSNKSEFYKDVPVTTAPADANAPVPTRRVQLNFAEAKLQVIERLRGSTVSARLDGLMGLVRNNLSRDLDTGVDPNKAYGKIVDDLTRSAGDMLAKPLTGLKIDSLSLDQAIERLTRAANISAICFPWGTHGSQTLLPSVKVTLSGDMTVRGALDDICRQVKFPRLEWATCVGFTNVLFSVQKAGQGIDFFPVTVTETELWTYEQFAEDQILSLCTASPSGRGESFAQTLFSAKGLSSVSRKTAMVEVGGQGLLMYMQFGGSGQLLWRLVKVAPTHVPQTMTPEIRRQVVSDLKLAAAMKLATKTAETVRDAALSIGLATTAKRKKLDVITTGLFSRRILARDMVSVRWSAVPKLDELDTVALVAYFIPKAFELMPKDLDANTASLVRAVAVVSVPAKAEVLVIERNGYQPVLKQEYEGGGRRDVARILGSQRYLIAMGAWFSPQQIFLRTGYKHKQ